MTTHVTGFARSAAVKLQTEETRGVSAVTAVVIACRAMAARLTAMFLTAETPDTTAFFAR